jgi:hypothetical protein
MRIRLPLSLVLIASAGWTGDASAQSATSRACAEAASAGQVRRDEGKLVEARSKFVMCAQPHCPKLIQKDCAEWQSQVDERLPTIVLGVKDDAGQDISDVVVTMDGKPFATRIEGRSIPVDPGAHKFHFEAAGLEPGDAEAVVKEGERARAIETVLHAPPKVIVEPPREPAPSGPGALRWVLGGIGVVGLGAGTAFFLSGLSERDELERTCQTRPGGCTSDETSGLRMKQTLDIVSFSVGGAALAAAIIVFVASSGSSSAQIKASPTQGGAKAELDVRF